MANLSNLKATKIQEALQSILMGIQSGGPDDYCTDVFAVDIEDVKSHASYAEHELPRLFILDDEDNTTHKGCYVAGEQKIQIQGLMYNVTYREKNGLINDIKRAIYKDVTWGGTITHPSGGLRTVSDLGLIKPYTSFIITVVAHYHTKLDTF